MTKWIIILKVWVKVCLKAFTQREVVNTQNVVWLKREIRQSLLSNLKVFTRKFKSFIRYLLKLQTPNPYLIYFNLTVSFQPKISTVSWALCMIKHKKEDRRKNKSKMIESLLTSWRIKHNPITTWWNIKSKTPKEKPNITKNRWISLKNRCTKRILENRKLRASLVSSRYKFKNMKIRLSWSKDKTLILKENVTN